VNEAKGALASATSAARPSRRNTSVLRGLNRRAFGCGDTPVCFSTSTGCTPSRRSSKAAVSPAMPPPLIRTGTRVIMGLLEVKVARYN